MKFRATVMQPNNFRLWSVRGPFSSFVPSPSLNKRLTGTKLTCSSHCIDHRGRFHFLPVPSVPATNKFPPTRSFWQRRVRDPIIAQLTQGITPEKIALTLAVGSAFALFPILGTTTLLCFLAAYALRLNQPITQLINQACWPLHVPAIFLCVRLGEKIFGSAPVHFSIREMNSLFWKEPARFFQDFGTTALHAISAWAVLAPLYMLAVYYVSLPLMRSVSRIKAEAAAKAAQAPDHPVP